MEGLAYIHHGVNFYSSHSTRHRPSRSHTRITHRDISPDNLFLRSHRGHHYPDIVIGDFGFATDKSTTEDYMKPHYQGPECPTLTHKGDVWAAGAVIHALGTGKDVMTPTPSGWEDKAWWRSGKSRQPRELPGKYDGDLDRAMWKCFKGDVDKRVDSYELVCWLRKHSPLSTRSR